MFSLAVLLCCLGALVSSAPQKVFYTVEEADSYFEDFINTYKKEYKSEAEKQYRFEIFKSNLMKINEKNKMENRAVYGINQFTDLSEEEFLATHTGLLPPGAEQGCVKYGHNRTRVAAPDAFDWRDQNKVTSVKNQHECGACWAFSTAATIEGQYAIKYNQLIDLSPQQILDCAKPSNGCDGGWITNGILAMQDFGGVMTEQDYPYENAQGSCRADASKIAVKVAGCRQFTASSEDELKDILVQVGPLSIGVATRGWHDYHGGILKDCDQQLNHAVLLVGYGSENGEPYWIIKNSWGAQWGESGYVRLEMYKNMCSFMNSVIGTAVVS